MSQNTIEIKNGLLLNISEIEGFFMVKEFVPSANRIILLNLLTDQEVIRDYDSIKMALETSSINVTALSAERAMEVVKNLIEEKTIIRDTLKAQYEHAEKEVDSLRKKKNFIQRSYN